MARLHIPLAFNGTDSALHMKNCGASRHGWVNGQMEALEKLALIILASIPERLETLILIMINRKKVFTVLGLMFIRFAISLLERPCNNSSTACFSLVEKLNS